MITWILVGLIVLLVLDGGRMRGRIGSLATVERDGVELSTSTDSALARGEPDVVHAATAPPQPGGEFCFILAPGVAIDATARLDAIAFAVAHDLDLVDLVPRALPAIRAMSLAQVIDPAKFRRDRIAAGRTAAHALLVTADVARRAQLGDGTTDVHPRDEIAFMELAGKLRHYAGTADLAVLATPPGPAPLSHRRAILRHVFGPLYVVALAIQPVMWALMAFALWESPVAGAIAIGAWHLQPLVALAGTPIHAPDLLVVAVARAPIELYTLLATIAGTWRPPPPPDPVDERRPTYAALAGKQDTFWEPRRQTCLVCGSADLAVHLNVSDLLQHKPGRFTLERCRACGHIFQNPRLSIAGLDYYYKDFYDGLGEKGMEMIFGFGSRAYHERAKLVRAHAGGDPPRWLDVGAGHGHFCAAAREDLPTTTFDGLDLSESIDEAHRRGWITTKYRGLFPELAPTLASAYDAVSMSHYLEHTLDPRDELAAARTALASGGYLLIEVPDPEYRLGRALGRLWLPWFQPQHLNLLSVGNLEKLLREHGFEPLEWHRGQAHQRVDLFFAVMLAVEKIAPPRAPWRPHSAARGAWRFLVYAIGLPIIGLASLADFALGPFIRRGKRSNTYRVIARKT
jgi:SAM-dependent methyltransferase